MTLYSASLALALVTALVAAGLMLLARGRSASVSKRALALSASRGWAAAPASREVRITRGEAGSLDRLAQRFLPRPAALRTRLEATGQPLTMGHYLAASVGTAFFSFAVLVMIGGSVAGSLFMGVAAGAWLPHMVVGRLGARRSARFLKVLPDAIGLIVRGLRAGLPVSETIAVVARETADPVGEEFRAIADQVRLGRPLEEAMWDTAKRLDIPEFSFLVISLSVQRETGGNLAETLDNLNQILRNRSQMKLKIKAMSSEATASALIIGSLPFVMAVLMMLFSPDYLSVLFTDPLGQMLVAGGVTSLLAGAFIMRQMVRFEI